ncbi:response regulator transcription factor [Frondihabitans australicus]|uniref:LuxR family two component transcriptional regulator n=1 Tax=Frondihabitans australicus TaxID=386892 RepID=A0A495II66_9MICO|nr:response regulator transcription factor [Frondihabitans australicus]RKR75108.1 LuxR family two component transcriptional regulator [Frondihabitans australicus]
MTTRILVVDDDPLVRTGIRLLCRDRPGLEVVGEAGDGLEAIRLLEEESFDVVLMDVHMRRTSGVAAAMTLRRRHPGLRIVLMTGFADAGFEQHARNAGADAFVPKTASVDVLLGALGSGAGAGASPHGVDAARPGGLLAGLSERERAVAGLVVDGWSNPQIAERLHLSSSTVKTYVSRCFTKLGVENRVQLANLLRDRAGD